MNRFDYRKFNYYNIAAYLFFFFLIIWAVITKEERTFISDPAYYFFNIVNKADFFYPGVRYTAIINQWPLVIAARFNLPLEQLLTVFSVSFVVVRLFYFFLVNNVFKNRAAGYAVIAISFIGVAESYFRPTSESTIALLNSIALYAWLCYNDENKKWGMLSGLITLFGAIAFIVFGYISHPLSMFSLFIAILLYILEKDKGKNLVPYISLLVLFGIFGFKIFLSKEGYRDTNFYGNLSYSPSDIINEFKTYYPFKWFKNHFKFIYYPYAILAVGTLVIGLRKKRWFTVLFFLMLSVVYFVMVCISFKEGDANMQMEKIFLPNVMFAALTFGILLRHYRTDIQWKLSIIPIVALIFSIYINLANYKPRYTRRVNDLYKMVEIANKESNRKLVITPKQIAHWPLAYCWAYGIETLIISSINEDMKPLTVFIAKNPDEIRHKMEQPDNFMPATFETSFTQKNLNTNYFKLPEENYVIWEEKFGKE